jgi:hypothetical protein
MSKPVFVLACLLLSTASLHSQSGQSRIGLSTGLAIDLNNSGRFKQIPLSFYWLPGKPNTSTFILKADLSFPIGGGGKDSAFTLATGLPPAIAVEKTTRNKSWAILIGYRFVFKTSLDKNRFFIDFLPIGISQQSFKISYKNYNSNEYEVINPDEDLKRAGWVGCFGVGYTIGNLVLQVQTQTPIIAVKTQDYAVSYHSAAPLSLTIGYLVTISKHKK